MNVVKLPKKYKNKQAKSKPKTFDKLLFDKITKAKAVGPHQLSAFNKNVVLVEKL
jgi:hypothetical protein